MSTLTLAGILGAIALTIHAPAIGFGLLGFYILYRAHWAFSLGLGAYVVYTIVLYGSPEVVQGLLVLGFLGAVGGAMMLRPKSGA